MEREVGGGIGMGNTCKPMAVSFQCMTKFTTKYIYIYIVDLQFKKKKVFSSTTVQKHQFFSVQPSLWCYTIAPCWSSSLDTVVGVC